MRGASVHEPPLFALLADDPESQAILGDLREQGEAVIREIEAGEAEAGARRFVDEIAIGAGAWEAFPPEIHETMVRNAATFAEEERDPTVYAIDLDALSRFDAPVLLTHGDQSPPLFPLVIDRLQAALPHAERRVFDGVGHVPQMTHPDAYAAAMLEFFDSR